MKYKTKCQRIREFMENMNENWSELDKFIYICYNVAMLYEYQFGIEHAYSPKKAILAKRALQYSYIIRKNINWHAILNRRRKRFS